MSESGEQLVFAIKSFRENNNGKVQRGHVNLKLHDPISQGY